MHLSRPQKLAGFNSSTRRRRNNPRFPGAGRRGKVSISSPRTSGLNRCWARRPKVLEYSVSRLGMPVLACSQGHLDRTWHCSVCRGRYMSHMFQSRYTVTPTRKCRGGRSSLTLPFAWNNSVGKSVINLKLGYIEYTRL